MNRNVRTALALAIFACASLILLVPASAQSVYGSIFGTVTDKSGAAVPGATVTVKDEAKGTVVTAMTNGAGEYSVPHLIPDVYDLKASAKGFKSFETTGISVLADTAPRIDPTLEVGGGSETVTVTAESAPELKTDKADVSTVFDEQQVSSLPIGDQNFTNLQLLLPGAQLLGWSHSADENPQASKQIQVDGQAFGGTAFELDGTDNEDPILGIIVINPATDSVTETKITTQNFDAELGKAVSAVVTAQTRSGSNKFHGSAYDYRTGNANEARDPYTEAPLSYTDAHGEAPSIPAGLKNRMGASIGGPILKNKAFFFFNYEGQRQKVGTAATDTLPTGLATETCLGNVSDSKGGNGCDLSDYLALPGGTGIAYDNSGANPVAFPNNIIPRSYMQSAASAPALALLKILEPYSKGISATAGQGSNGLDSNYHASGTGLFNSNMWTERVDYTFNEKMHVFERFSRFTDVLSGAVMFGAAGGPGFGLSNYGGNSTGANDSAAAGLDYALSPKLLTDVRLGYYRYNVIDAKYDSGTQFATQLGIPGINAYGSLSGGVLSGAPGFFINKMPGSISNGSSNTDGGVFGASLAVDKCNCPLTEREDQFQIVNNWTRIMGNHTFKAGVDLRYGRNLRVPSDTDRDGNIHFDGGPTSNPALGNPGLSWATFMLGQVDNFNRYYSVSTNAKEFQKRFYFYGQDTWRVNAKLTLNLGVRWDMYSPERVNGNGQGALLNLSDGYLHVAGIGGVPLNMGWNIRESHQFAPRIGLTYQYDAKTVVRAGFGRSFDTGVFGSIFGHTVTQNLPVLGNQSKSATTPTGTAFTLNVGPPAPTFPAVPANGLLPAPGFNVSSNARPNPLNMTTIDAWNLSVQRSITPTLSLTVAYVGNKGTHTLGDGDSNSTNPNEAAINVPGAYSVTGQTLNYDPNGLVGVTQKLPGSYTGGVATSKYLERFYGGKLAACSDPNYYATLAGLPGGATLAGLQNANGGDVNLQAGMCGWSSGINAYHGDDQNTEFDALQITLAKQMSHGLNVTANYQWASAFDEQSSYFTWSHSITHGRDSNVRDQQMTIFGSYDLPIGKGKSNLSGISRGADLFVGGWQISDTMNLAGGLPFSLSYGKSAKNVPSNSSIPGQTAPNWPSAAKHMQTALGKYTPNGNGTGGNDFYVRQVCDLTDPTVTCGGAVNQGGFFDPGLDTIGNVRFNSYRGPKFFTSDMALTKSFSIWESVQTKIRMDAYNAFNHINAGNPSGNIESDGSIGGQAQGCNQTGASCGPRQLEFSLRVQF